MAPKKKKKKKNIPFDLISFGVAVHLHFVTLLILADDVAAELGTASVPRAVGVDFANWDWIVDVVGISKRAGQGADGAEG